MTRPSTRIMCALLLEAGILTLAPPASAGGARTVSIVQPPDRFFQNGPALDVVVAYAGQVWPQNRGDGGSRLQLIVDGTVVEERVLASDNGVTTFSLPLNQDTPVSLVQVCVRRGDGRSDPLSCSTVRAAGSREFGLMRQTLEEMSQIGHAVVRYTSLRLPYGQVPRSLQELVPNYLERAPAVSPLSTAYEYLTQGGHFALRAGLPGVGEIRIEDGSFTKLPRGAITDREAARLTRQELRDLALPLEEYWIDNTRYPDRLEDVFPLYGRFLPLTDPYGRPYIVTLSPDTYLLTGLGRDGKPRGEGFDADTEMVQGMQIAQTTPYRGRFEYERRTYEDMSEIASALAYFLEQTGRYPDSLSELIGGPWFSRARAFTDFCGNPYRYEVHDVGFGIQEYRLQAFGCDGIPDTDPNEYWLFFFSADNKGHVTAPVPWGFAFTWLGILD